MRDTLIVFTSDHGEFSGDRGLGEKELLYDEIVRVPFIVCDPDPRADATRGTRRSALRRRHRRRADDPRRARHRRRAASRRGTLAAAADCAASAPSSGATPCSPSSTTDSGARAGCWAAACASAARYMVRTSATGSTSTGKAFGRSSSISSRDPREHVDLGADPRHDAVRARHARAAVRLARDGQAPDDRRRRGGRGAHRRPSRARHPHRHLVRRGSAVASRMGRQRMDADDEQPCG